MVQKESDARRLDADGGDAPEGAGGRDALRDADRGSARVDASVHHGDERQEITRKTCIVINCENLVTLHNAYCEDCWKAWEDM